MHEMGIASSILEAVQAESERHPSSRVLKVALRIGEYAGVDTESLRFCFDALKDDAGLGGAELVIDYLPKSTDLQLTHLELED